MSEKRVVGMRVPFSSCYFRRVSSALWEGMLESVVLRHWLNLPCLKQLFLNSSGSFVVFAVLLLLKVIKGLTWWSSGYDFMLPMQGARVRSPVRELRSHIPQLSPRAATRETYAPQRTACAAKNE